MCYRGGFLASRINSLTQFGSDTSLRVGLVLVETPNDEVWLENHFGQTSETRTMNDVTRRTQIGR